MVKSRISLIILAVCSLPIGFGCSRLPAVASSGSDGQSTSWPVVPGSGTFSFASSGYAFEIGELANNPDRAQKKTSLNLAVSGTFELISKADTLTIEFNIAASPPSTNNVTLAPEPPVPTSWRVTCLTEGHRFYPKFKASRSLTGNELFATRCFLSYWKQQMPPKGDWESRELDGNFGVKTVSTPNPLVTNFQWSTASDTLPGLAELPNRTSVPLIRKVSGELVSTIEKQGRRLEGKRTLKSYLGDNLVAENNLDISFWFEPNSHSPSPEAATSVEYELAPTSDVLQNERELQVKFLKGATLKSILASIPTTPLETKKRNERFLQLRALFYLEPEKAMIAAKSVLST
ncbi:MAG TPA: hypothetical protein VK171_08590, partial [Fimbriimonas sp.]|nr:hypothetical protein [Fimbriimonas sp.]